MSTLAPVTHTLEDQVRTTVFDPRLVNPIEILTLAEEMKHYGDKTLTGVVERLWSASHAIDTAIGAILEPKIDTSDLLAIDPAELTERVIAAANAEAVRTSLAYDRVRNWYDRALVTAARDAMKTAADQVVAKMRPVFDEHLQVIYAAAQAGLSKDTTPAELLSDGTAEAVDAYRVLPAAVTALDQLAGLRHRMTQYLTYGPIDWEVCAFVTDIPDQLTLDGAASRYAGETEVRQYHQESRGATMIQAHKRVLGGRWLDLVNGGYKLRLNTADEAAEVLATTYRAA